MTKQRGRTEEQQQMFPGGPTVAALHESDVLASLSRFARAFDTDRETLRRCLLENNVEPAGEHAGHKLYALRHVYRAWTQATEDTDPDKLTPFKRRAWYQGEREKLHLQVERGELLEGTEVERMLGQVLQLCARGLETAQDVVERDCGLAPAQAAKLEGHLDSIREELFQAIQDVGLEESPQPEAVQTSAQAGDETKTSDRETKAGGGATKQRRPETKSAKRETRTRRPAPSLSGSAVDDAAVFLREQLAAGPKPKGELVKAGKKFGLSDATLRRAKASLGDELVARRQGRGWVWELSPAPKPASKRKRKRWQQPCSMRR